MNNYYGYRNWGLVQDGATPHTAEEKIYYLKTYCNVLDNWSLNILKTEMDIFQDRELGTGLFQLFHLSMRFSLFFHIMRNHLLSHFSIGLLVISHLSTVLFQETFLAIIQIEDPHPKIKNKIYLYNYNNRDQQEINKLAIQIQLKLYKSSPPGQLSKFEIIKKIFILENIKCKQSFHKNIFVFHYFHYM